MQRHDREHALTSVWSEDVSNSLRRVDWRFLLPNPHPLRSICYAHGALAEAVARISAATSDPRRDAAQKGRCDLAVAVNPPAVTLKSALAALAPGGSLYVEWRTPLVEAATVRKRLAGAGFEQIRCYEPSANPSIYHSVSWVPLERPGARRYASQHLPARMAYGLPFPEFARRALGFLVPGRYGVSICATARKPAPAVADALQAAEPALDFHDEMLRTIRERWRECKLDSSHEDLSWLLLTPGTHSSNKIIGLIFAEPEPRPRIAVKMVRTEAGVAALNNEVRTLEALAPRASELRSCHGFCSAAGMRAC